MLRAVLLLLLLVVNPAWAAERRIALVVGNASYAEGALRNPVNDARDMRAQLLRLGFAQQDIIYRENLKVREVGSLLRELRSRLQSQPGAVALVFYAGHGVQMRGENYFPAVDAHIEGEDDLPLQSLRLGSVLDTLAESKTRLNLLLLDACRNNPFRQAFRSGTRGLGRVETGLPSGTLIAYATRPNDVAADGEGRNGVFTSALLRHMAVPGQPVEQMLKRVAAAVDTLTGGRQEPWVEGSIRGDFYMAGQQPAVVAQQPAQAPPSGVNLDDLMQEDAERRRWADWQQRMQAEYDKVAAFGGGPDLQVKAWERYLAAWAENNPGSDRDEALRERARKMLAEAQQALAAPRLPPPPVTASPLLAGAAQAALPSAAMRSVMNENLQAKLDPALWERLQALPGPELVAAPWPLRVEFDATTSTTYTGTKSRSLPASPPTRERRAYEFARAGGSCEWRLVGAQAMQQEYLVCGGLIAAISRFGSGASVTETLLTGFSVEGQLFPMQAGNRFRATAKSRYGGATRGTMELIVNCSVQAAVPAASLGAELAGNAWPVACETSWTGDVNGHVSKHDSEGAHTSHFIEALGTFDNVFMLVDGKRSRLPREGVSTVLDVPGDYGSRITTQVGKVQWQRAESGATRLTTQTP